MERQEKTEAASGLLKEELKAYLRQRNMRVTPERLRIMEHICSLAYPATIEEIHKSVASVFHVSLATVYNTVQLLMKAGFISCRAGADGKTLYGPVAGDSVAFVCRICGKTKYERINLRVVGAPPLKSRGFSTEDVVVTVSGLCRSCSIKESKIRNRK